MRRGGELGVVILKRVSGDSSCTNRDQALSNRSVHRGVSIGLEGRDPGALQIETSSVGD